MIVPTIEYKQHSTMIRKKAQFDRVYSTFSSLHFVEEISPCSFTIINANATKSAKKLLMRRLVVAFFTVAEIVLSITSRIFGTVDR